MYPITSPVTGLPARLRGPAPLVAIIVAVVVSAGAARSWAKLPVVRNWATVFAAICVQATPFVVLGTVLAAGVGLASADRLRRWVPRRASLAIPALGLAGVALPGCECGAVNTAAAMMHRGLPAGAAVSFALSASSVNPVVLAATAAAFPGRTDMVAGRFAAGLITAVAVGTLTASGALGKPQLRCIDHHRGARGPGRAGVVAASASELARSLGLLTLGAAAAASMTVLIPRTLLQRFGSHALIGIGVLAVLAVLLCVCSQADAFVARSFAGYSRSAQFSFMVVGAAVDLKVLSLQTGAFGLRFAIRACACAFVVALSAAISVVTVLAVLR